MVKTMAGQWEIGVDNGLEAKLSVRNCP